MMDNLPVHHAQCIRAAIEAADAKLVFLPPYSPDLSPIELCWESDQQFLRLHKACTYDALDECNDPCDELYH